MFFYLDPAASREALPALTISEQRVAERIASLLNFGLSAIARRAPRPIGGHALPRRPRMPLTNALVHVEVHPFR